MFGVYATFLLLNSRKKFTRVSGQLPSALKHTLNDDKNRRCTWFLKNIVWQNLEGEKVVRGKSLSNRKPNINASGSVASG